MTSVLEGVVITAGKPLVDTDVGNSAAKEDTVEMLKTAAAEQRFRIMLSAADVDRQLETRIKVLARFSLKPFHPYDEEAFEDWVDEAAAIVTRNQICLPIFQEAWANVARPGYALKIAAIPLQPTYEALATKVAQIYFIKSKYVCHLERTIFYPPEIESVMEAQMWVEANVARYTRLCNRWNRSMMVKDDQLIGIATAALPKKIRKVVQSHLPENPTLETIWNRARKDEDIEMVDFSSKAPIKAFPATLKDVPMKESSSSSKKSKLDEAKSCTRCGGTGHFAKNCPKKDYRCRQCHNIGHIAKACRTIVKTDADGRISTKVEDKKGETVIKQRKDATVKDKLASAEGTLRMIKDKAEQKAVTASQRRKEKAEKEGKIPKKKKIIHFEGAAEEESEKPDEDSSENEDSETDEEIFHSLEACLAHAKSKQREAVVRITAIINNVKHDMIADTGAARSLCSGSAAILLGLEESGGKAKRFIGLGEVSGTPMKPVKVMFPRAEGMVRFWRINGMEIPTLLGRKDLVKFRVLIDPEKNLLINKDTLLPVNVFSVSESTETKIDTMTQKALGATDIELLESGKKLLLSKCAHLNSELQKKVWQLFDQHKGVWLRPNAGGACKHAAQFKVKGSPVKLKQRHMAPELKAELEKQIADMLNAGVIQKSKSAWGAAPLFVKKKDGGWRLCVDYRKLNQQMVSDQYPLPLLWQQVQKTAGHLYYITIDLNWGFWNLPLHPESRHYTAFITHLGLYEFKVVPFGVKNSPPEFQRMMDTVMAELLSKNVVCYVDDIIIYGNKIPEILELLREVLRTLCNNGLCIKLEKVTILQPQVLMLGHIVDANGIRPNPIKVQGIRDAQMPRNAKQMKSFLGSVGFLRKFIPNCSTITAPLARLVKKRVPFIVDDEVLDAFYELKALVSEHTMLNSPRGTGEFVITCDASDVGVGGSLMQNQEGELEILEYASRTLNQTERNWSTYEKEAFAIRWAVERFQDYIRTTGALLLTDHKSLEWIANSTSGKVRRWALFLQQFDLRIMHISGELNHVADWLSRSRSDDDVFNDDNEVGIPQFVGEERTLLEQEGAETSNILYLRIPTLTDLQIATQQEESVELDKYTYLSADGVRYHTRTHATYIPKVYRETFMHYMHASKRGMHGGINKTVRSLRKWVWWPSLAKDVSEYIQGCLTCKRVQPLNRRMYLANVLVRAMPFELISIDSVGPKNWWGKSWYYVVIIDHASRFLMARASKEPVTARFVIEMLKNQWLPAFHAPYAILTDRGSEYMAKEFREYALKQVGCALVKTSPYYPQGNAVNEASHKALGNMLRAANENLEMTFEDHLREAVQVHNACPHVATNQSPYYLLFGMEPTMPGWQSLQWQEKAVEVRVPKLQEHRKKEMVRLMLLKDEHLRLTRDKIKIGDWIVYLITDAERPSIHDKYSMSWSLPAKVVELKDKACVVLEWLVAKPRQVPLAHVRKLQGEVPASLQPLNYRALTKELPKAKQVTVTGKPVTWDELLQKADREVQGTSGIDTEIGSLERKRRKVSSPKST